jgi:hypothetical protein
MLRPETCDAMSRYYQLLWMNAPPVVHEIVPDDGTVSDAPF